MTFKDLQSRQCKLSFGVVFTEFFSEQSHAWIQLSDFNSVNWELDEIKNFQDGENVNDAKEDAI